MTLEDYQLAAETLRSEQVRRLDAAEKRVQYWQKEYERSGGTMKYFVNDAIRDRGKERDFLLLINRAFSRF